MGAKKCSFCSFRFEKMLVSFSRLYVEQKKVDRMLYFSVNEPRGKRTYIYDIDEHYVIVLEPRRDKASYYLLTAYHLEGKDYARDKILRKYNRNRLPELL